MSRLNAALAGALPILLLASCGSQERASVGNAAAGAEANALETAGPSDPAASNTADGSVDPVPPPDAVSHPNGYLPPAPGEPDPPGANSSGPDSSRPATEDEYLRNGQAGR